MSITTAAPTTAWAPIRLRELVLPHRVWLSPMCQYSADLAGRPTDWHLQHYGARAAGGFAMTVVEATGIAPDMRTTVRDLGLWDDEQEAGHRRLVEVIRAGGSVPALQLAIAGRKSSHGAPWDDTGTRTPLRPEDGGWQPLAPSPIPFADLAAPREMTGRDIARVLSDLERAARLADSAGYEALALQGANGYLLHQFLSPLANHRSDGWGGDTERRMRFPLAVVEALRAGWPDGKPLMMRLPATDLLDGGLTVDDVVALARRMADTGVDLIDLESGTLTPTAPRPDEPLHNLRYGPRFRDAGVAVAASGGVVDADHLAVAVPGLVDAVFVGRAALRDPYWALRVRGGDPRASWPRQYHRALQVGPTSSRASRGPAYSAAPVCP